jgi:DNA-binding transcriptional LysR family regulator
LAESGISICNRNRIMTGLKFLLRVTLRRLVAPESLFDDQIFVVAGQKSPWSRRRKIALSELLHEPWIMPEPDNLAWALMVEGFGAARLAAPTPQVVSSSIAVRIRLVESGSFLSILPHSNLHFGQIDVAHWRLILNQSCALG